MKILVFYLIGAAFFGTKIFSFDVGLFQLSPYRILVILIPLLFLASYRNQRKFNISKSDNYYSYLFFLFCFLIMGPRYWIKRLTLKIIV